MCSSMSFPDRHFQSACNINDIIRIGSLLACWLLLLKKLSPCVTYTEGIPDRISTLRIHSVYVHEVTDSATMDDGDLDWNQHQPPAITPFSFHLAAALKVKRGRQTDRLESIHACREGHKRNRNKYYNPLSPFHIIRNPLDREVYCSSIIILLSRWWPLSDPFHLHAECHLQWLQLRHTYDRPTHSLSLSTTMETVY